MLEIFSRKMQIGIVGKGELWYTCTQIAMHRAGWRGAVKLYLGKKDELWQRPVRDMALSLRRIK